MEHSQLASAFKFLGGDERIRIVLFLSSGEKCVCKIYEHIGVPQNLASYHLAALRNARIVTSRKEGKWVYYSLNNTCFEELFAFLQKVTKARKAHKAGVRDKKL